MLEPTNEEPQDEPSAPPEVHKKPRWALHGLVWTLLVASGFGLGRATTPERIVVHEVRIADEPKALAPPASPDAGVAADETAPSAHASLLGVVVDEAGAPIAGASISIAGPPPRVSAEELAAQAQTPTPPSGELGVTDGPVPPIPVAQAEGPVLGPSLVTTGKRGRFRLEGLDRGTLQVVASHRGFAPSAVTLDLREAAPRPPPLRIVLRRAGDVRGKVQASDGTALSSALVVGRTEDGLTVTAMSDGAGLFTLKDVRGKLHAQAFVSGHVPASCDTVVDAATRDARCDFVLTKDERDVPETGGRIAGYVLDVLGRPVAGANVWTDEADAVDTTNVHGEFLLRNVAEGALIIFAEEKSAGAGRSHEVRARDDQTLSDVRIYLPSRFVPSADFAASTEPKTSPKRPTKKRTGLSLEMRADHVVVSSPGPSSDLRSGDVLHSVDGERVLSLAQARGMLRDPAGQVAKVRVGRANKTLTVRYARPAMPE